MVAAAHSGKYGVDYTPTELSVIGIYPNAMPWAEALGNHTFKPRIFLSIFNQYSCSWKMSERHKMFHTQPLISGVKRYGYPTHTNI